MQQAGWLYICSSLKESVDYIIFFSIFFSFFISFYSSTWFSFLRGFTTVISKFWDSFLCTCFFFVSPNNNEIRVHRFQVNHLISIMKYMISTTTRRFLYFKASFVSQIFIWLNQLNEVYTRKKHPTVPLKLVIRYLSREQHT